jgi:hypothetical protein
MTTIRSTLLAGSILALLVSVAFVTVIATGAAIPASANCLGDEHTMSMLD